MNGATIGVSICEDIWYPDGPVFFQALSGGAEVIINISSSPYHAGKRHWRERMLGTRAADNTAIVAYNNLVGAQDELVFDGDSLIFNENGDLLARGKQFQEELVVADLDVESVFRQRLHDPRRRQQKFNRITPAEIFPIAARIRRHRVLPVASQGEVLSEDAEIYQALGLGKRDYGLKDGFNKVVTALRGDID